MLTFYGLWKLWVGTHIINRGATTPRGTKNSKPDHRKYAFFSLQWVQGWVYGPWFGWNRAFSC